MHKSTVCHGEMFGDSRKYKTCVLNSSVEMSGTTFKTTEGQMFSLA